MSPVVSTAVGLQKMMTPKKVCVLLATYNGSRYVIEQINSIFSQRYVTCDIYVSDDCSTDNTLEIIKKNYRDSPHVFILPVGKKFGCAAANFYRLLMDAPIGDYEYVAFADQDDIWKNNKIERAIFQMSKASADAYSSNVTAFWPDGYCKVLIKSRPQRAYDFLFEPGGPGCTYVLKRETACLLKKFLVSSSEAQFFPRHDWLFYAVVRNSGRKWIIDKFSSLMYRQHAINEVGANVGLMAKINRIKMLRSGEYLGNVKKISLILGMDQSILFSENPFLFRYRFLMNLFKCRRNLREGLFLVIMVIIGIARVSK